MHTATDRFDIYAFIHKALRAFMADTLVRVGRSDAADDAEVEQTLEALAALLQLCRDHLHHEDRYLHSAMEARRPGSAAATLQDHGHHVESIAALEALAASVTAQAGAPRARALQALYRALALFVAENLEHMNVEETANAEVLWATHSDAELHAIEGAIVASQPPEKTALVARWMLPSLTAAERVTLLRGMQAGMPPAAFAGILQLGRQCLPDHDWFKLLRSLGPVAQAA